jgi:hypothetical protein
MFRGLGMGVAVCLAATAAAQDPSYVWQGRLLDAGGTPVHGQQDLTFTLTDDASQTLWAKTYEDVVVSDGFVGVVLSGDDDQVPAQGLAPHWFLADVDLTIAVGGTLLQTFSVINTVPRASAVVGAVQLTSSGACTPSDNAVGALRYESGSVYVCDGTQWLQIGAAGSSADGSTSSNAVPSCKAYAALQGDTTDQTRWVDPDGPGGFDPFLTQCELDSAGGGWTQVMRLNGGSLQINGTGREAFWSAGGNLTPGSWGYSSFISMTDVDEGFIGWDRLTTVGSHFEVRVVGVNENGIAVDEVFEMQSVDMDSTDSLVDVGSLNGVAGASWTAAVLGDSNTRSNWGVCGTQQANNSHVGFGLCPAGYNTGIPSGVEVQIWHYGNFQQCMNISLGEPGAAANYTYTCARGPASIQLYVREQ